MTYGLTIKRTEVEAAPEDTFEAPRPAFIKKDLDFLEPQQEEVCKPVRSSMVEQLQTEGKTDMANLLTQAQTLASKAATVYRNAKKSESKPKTEISKQTTAPQFEMQMSDEDFIIATRKLNPCTPDTREREHMEKLFYANGGAKHLHAGATFAQAWENFRREVMARIANKNKKSSKPYRRVNSPKEIKAFVPGMPTLIEHSRRANAERDARERLATEYWLKTPISKPTR